MTRLAPVLVLALSACTPFLKMPGPPSVVGRPAPVRAALPPSEPAPFDGVLERHLPETAPPAREPASSPAAGEGIAEAAAHYLAHTPRGYRSDCSGFVCAAANRAGLPLDGNTRGLWEIAHANGGVHTRKRPDLGDLAFFDQTYDRNRNGRLDDELTHVAVVIEVEEDGTVVLAHGGTGRGRTTLRMNLHHPSVRHDDSGRELNGYLRARTKSDPKRTRYLSGELWRGFATVDPAWFDEEVARN